MAKIKTVSKSSASSDCKLVGRINFAAQYVELLRLCGAIVVTRPDELSKYGKIKKKIITVDPDAYSDDLPNYAGELYFYGIKFAFR